MFVVTTSTFASYNSLQPDALTYSSDRPDLGWAGGVGLRGTEFLIQPIGETAVFLPGGNPSGASLSFTGLTFTGVSGTQPDGGWVMTFPELTVNGFWRSFGPGDLYARVDVGSALRDHMVANPLSFTGGPGDDAWGRPDAATWRGTLRGGAGDDSLSGSYGAADLIEGGTGDDLLLGYTGEGPGGPGARRADRLFGGAGDDEVHGADGNDLVNGGGGADLLYGREGNDEVVGGAGHDRLRGDEGRDRLSGGAGDDRLEGGLGSDRLRGGDGVDTFAFQAGERFGDPTDLVLDFRDGEDRLAFSNWSPAEVLAAATQDGADVRIELTFSTSDVLAVVLVGFDRARFDASDFG